MTTYLHKASLCLGLCAYLSSTAYARLAQYPLESVSAVEPNAMILLDTSVSMRLNNEKKLKLAKSAIRDIIDNTENVRLCVSKFATGDNIDTKEYTEPGYVYRSGSYSPPVNASGADINAAGCDSSDAHKAKLKITVSGYDAESSTPLAESVYDITEYFSNRNAHFGKSDQRKNPIQYRCQANHLIVLTDGEATNDWTDVQDASKLPSPLTRKTFTGIEKTLPDWDNTDGKYSEDSEESKGFSLPSDPSDHLANRWFHNPDKTVPNRTFDTNGYDIFRNTESTLQGQPAHKDVKPYPVHSDGYQSSRPFTNTTEKEYFKAVIVDAATNTIRHNGPFRPENPKTHPEGYSIYLDDLALYAKEIDLRTSGFDDADKSFEGKDDPITEITEENTTTQYRFEQQNLISHFIGLDLVPMPQVMTDAAKYSGGGLFNADSSDTESLRTALTNTFASIGPSVAASSSIKYNATFIDDDTYAYAARYDTHDWSGDLIQFKLSPVTGGIKLDASNKAIKTWQASEQIKAQFDGTYPRKRRIFTATDDNVADGNNEGDNRLLAFEAKYLLKAKLDKDITVKDSTDSNYIGYFNELIRYLSGDDKTSFRERSTPLGDITHTESLLFGKQAKFGYTEDSYRLFKNGDGKTNKGQANTVVVASNGGMVHVFNDYQHDDKTNANGEEVMAFVPPRVLPFLEDTSQHTYVEKRRFLLDGPPIHRDIRRSNKWTSVYSMGYGAGIKGLFALDLGKANDDGIGGSQTNQDESSDDYGRISSALSDNFYIGSFDEETIDTKGNLVFEDMGHVLNRPKIIRVKTDAAGGEKWLLVTGNGHHSKNGKTVVYLINLETGELDQDPIILEEPSAQEQADSRAGGATSISVLDYNQDSYVDSLYVGDLRGNVWRLDHGYGVTKSSSQTEESAFNEPNNAWFSATYSDSKNAVKLLQPITAEIVFDAPPDDKNGQGVMVYFGTGRYTDNEDLLPIETKQVQSFYAVYDAITSAGTDSITPSKDDGMTELVMHEEIQNELTTRVITSATSVDWTTSEARGWYLNLNLDINGERVIQRPLLSAGKVYFVSDARPNEVEDDPCLTGGSGWFYALHAHYGLSPRGASLLNTLDDEGNIIENVAQTIGLSSESRFTGLNDIVLQNGGNVSAGVRASNGGISLETANATAASDGYTDGSKVITTRKSWRQLQ